MHKNYKLDEQVITNIINRHIKPIEHKKTNKNSLSTTLNLKPQTSPLKITQIFPKLSKIKLI